MKNNTFSCIFKFHQDNLQRRIWLLLYQKWLKMFIDCSKFKNILAKYQIFFLESVFGSKRIRFLMVQATLIQQVYVRSPPNGLQVLSKWPFFSWTTPKKKSCSAKRNSSSSFASNDVELFKSRELETLKNKNHLNILHRFKGMRLTSQILQIGPLPYNYYRFLMTPLYYNWIFSRKCSLDIVLCVSYARKQWIKGSAMSNLSYK